MTCSICCELFNKSINTKIICPISNCAFEACKKCVRTYLLSTTNDPHCMTCKNQWEHKFLVDNLNKTFIDNDYRKHRKQLLVDREISRTPELMNIVQRTSMLDDEQKQLNTLQEEYNQSRKNLKELSQKLQEKKLLIYRIKNGEDTCKDERRKFIMPCPADNCKGYLSSQYKCEVCKLYTCHDCFEVIGYSKESPHECKQENIASAQLIKKETKPCPKCGVRIFKISGCDQMWCTECKVAFSWNTGKIVISGQVHNPHYYQYLRQNGDTNNTQAPRNPNDVLCGGMVQYYEFGYFIRSMNRFSSDSWFNAIKKEPTIDWFINKINLKSDKPIITNIVAIFSILSRLHRIVTHINNIDLVNLRNKVRNLSNFDSLVVKYILNNKTKHQLATDIFRNDNLRKKSVELLNVYELLTVVSIERFNYIYNFYTQHSKEINSSQVNYKLITDITLHVVNFINEYKNLLDIANKLFMQISYTYNMTVSIYLFENAKFITKTYKFTQKEYNHYLKNISTEITAEDLNKQRQQKKSNNNHQASSTTD